ncbi:DUF2809 domain-containing protein [Antarcticibacterium flavum]|uniref:DUF2809 domain-containing protein n=1 Tax=Antarcticibacterium flavum TaxID=2058175 RepID=A0A5B7X0N0_9FLAO|nr:MULTISPECIES: DUF2809 domain-containing protein [Antarcticibacterium]MCM4158888.1 DUF2809 domain-containing protein [Antarcticibacterium sp. W02-3]QCY68143.1 DUF2809 domain-containing protein [Antarcticibacterium flavum]
MLRFHPVYFLLTILFLTIEIIIAVYVNDRIIRPYLGDMLVVILIYCFVRTFLRMGVNSAILLVLGIAFVVEVLQYFNLIKFLEFQDSALAKTILGNTFSYEDLGMYLLGGFVIWGTEMFHRKRRFV